MFKAFCYLRASTDFHYLGRVFFVCLFAGDFFFFFNILTGIVSSQMKQKMNTSKAEAQLSTNNVIYTLDAQSACAPTSHTD